METREEKINSVWNGVTFIVVSVLSLINFTLNVKTYNSELFGTFILLNAIFSLGNSFDFGFGVSTIKFISESKLDGYKNLDSVFISFFVSYFVLALILFSGFEIYGYFFLDNIMPADSARFGLNYNLIFLFLNLTFLFRYFINYLNKVYEGIKQYILISKLTIGYNLIFTIIIFIIFLYKVPIFYLAVFMAAANAVFFFTLLLTLVTKTQVKFNIFKVDWGFIKRNINYNFNLQFSFLVNSFIDPLIKYLIAAFLSVNFVTYFETAKKIIDLSTGLIFSSQKGLMNNLSESKYKGTINKYINESIFQYSKISNVYSIAIYGFLNPLICLFIYFWFNSYEAMLIYLLFSIPYSIINFAGCLYGIFMLDGSGKLLIILQLSNFIFLGITLTTSLYFFNSFLGLIGFALSTVLNLILMFYILKKQYFFNVSEYLSKTNFRSLNILQVFLLAELLLLNFFPIYKYYILGLFFIISVISFHKFLIQIIEIFKTHFLRRVLKF